jgi:putative cell wall-binding protein
MNTHTARSSVRARRTVSALLALALVAIIVAPVPIVRLGEPPGQAYALDYGSEVKLTASDRVMQEMFGRSVAVSAQTAIIGAPFDDDNGMFSGSAYIFTTPLAGGAWTQHNKLFASDSAMSDMFGWAVAIDGNTAVVGAPYKGAGGAAYVFVRTSGGAWTQQAKLTVSGAMTDYTFGASVAVHRNTIVVGAPGRDTGRGAAYVFTRSGTAWTEQAMLSAGAEGAAHDGFGLSVALMGDTAVIGTPSSGEQGIDSGSAYVFVRSGSSWSRQQKLLAADGGPEDEFGFSVGIHDDTAVIGAPHNADTGAAYVFSRVRSSWAEEGKLVRLTSSTGDRFGFSVAISGGTIVVGAPREDSVRLGEDAGAAYVYNSAAGFWKSEARLGVEYGGNANDEYGYSVALCGGRAFVGAPFDGPTTGAVYTYRLRPSVPTGVIRLAGLDRYATAVSASKAGFRYGAQTVVIATGLDFPDALGGGALAGTVGGPLLLTRSTSLPADVKAEITRLGASSLYVLGGTGAVSTAVENELGGMPGIINVVRLSGSDRYATANAVATTVRALKGSSFLGTAFVATGANYPDALAASPMAAHHGMPILLANPLSNTVAVPAGVERVFVLGGVGAVSAVVEASLDSTLGDSNVTRIGGIDRYDTAAVIAYTGLFSGVQLDPIGLATGENFPDALSGGAMLGSFRCGMLLTRTTTLSAPTRTVLEGASPVDTLFIFGGTGVISADVESAARAAAGL